MTAFLVMAYSPSNSSVCLFDWVSVCVCSCSALLVVVQNRLQPVTEVEAVPSICLFLLVITRGGFRGEGEEVFWSTPFIFVFVDSRLPQERCEVI